MTDKLQSPLLGHNMYDSLEYYACDSPRMTKRSQGSLPLGLVVAFATLGAADEVSYSRDVRPILSDRCFHCHGPDAENQQSEFRLDTRENAIADLGGYAGIVPGDLEKSELHHRIRSQGDVQMPPPDAVRQLTIAEKDILDAWIRQGAPFDAHWSFQPIPDEVPVPDTGNDWASNEIDHFIFHRLTRAGLSPNVAASREKWLRRVTFDVTGLPPTIAELDAFLNDSSERAYRLVVDRLLESDACAERLASEWLDVARYSDSFGYQRDDERFVWPWRDWVIRAFHENMPYDDFITWQLAGDLFPKPTRDQVLATTFNRLHSHKKEGGVAIEEFRVENVADRTHTFAAAFLGITMECARCHDHKYDPITTKEYYELSSFFANIDEHGLISYFTDAVPTPAMPLPSEKQTRQLEAASEEVANAERELAKAHADGDSFEAWLARREVSREVTDLRVSLSFEGFAGLNEDECRNEEGRKVARDQLRGFANAVKSATSAVTTKANQLVSGKHGKAIQLTGDDAVVVPGAGHFARHHAFSVSLWLRTPEVRERAVIYRRSRGWDDAGSIGYELVKLGHRLSAKLVHFWPGNAICVETDDGALTPQRWHHVVVTYDGSSKASGLRIFLDGCRADTTVVQDCLTRNITQWRGGYYDLAIGARYRDRGFKGGTVDEFNVFGRQLAELEVRQLFDGVSLHQALTKPTGLMSDDDRTALKEFFLAAVHDGSRQKRLKLSRARERLNVVMDSIPAISIMREQKSPRPAHVLMRGAYDRHGERVEAGTPGSLPAFSDDRPRNRLGLARWLTAPNHPLTARVTVNRYWQMVFGKGLVRTPEDFGRQGESPTHPELLDWLARDFIEHGWDVRRLLRMLVLSATYRQSAVVMPGVRSQDPENIWLARGPAQRLSAEMVRDNALAVSGLLCKKIGGPPVKPYDVALGYTPLPVDEGEGLYRRSLYTFWKRTSPAPVMMTMNANRREVCQLQRDITASPLQALVLLNGPQFVEAARVLGTELLKKHDDIDSIVQEAFRLLTSRLPTEQEAAILQSLYEEQLADFQADADRADELLKVGQAAIAHELSSAKVAAATVLVNSIMNLNESVRHR